jgi:hypothetical protein
MNECCRQAVKEREAEIRASNLHQLCNAKITRQAEEIARLTKDCEAWAANYAELQAHAARLRAALEAIAMRTDGPSFHLGGDIRGIINEALRTDAL